MDPRPSACKSCVLLLKYGPASSHFLEALSSYYQPYPQFKYAHVPHRCIISCEINMLVTCAGGFVLAEMSVGSCWFQIYQFCAQIHVESKRTGA